ncbi:MAG: 2-C-methyl-D-erythritol 4-phosphate cytidylyltransferase [Candidatus Eremiobacteraeota bacterium]|nr:2-C-methyl-D-erythritol 4-phosphate cytidylyltransferase [Candidatus Eremiobacteraeota bacterium]
MSPGTMVWAAVIVAAGRGVRFGGPKQLIEVGGRPLVSWCIETFGNLDEIAEIVIATEPEHMDGMAELAGRYAQNTPSVVVVGGATRQGSTRNGIRAVSERCEAVLVHDGARPLVTAADVRAGMAAVAPGRGAVLAAPVVDTIKVVPRGTRTVTQTLDRADLWAAQTP